MNVVGMRNSDEDRNLRRPDNLLHDLGILHKRNVWAFLSTIPSTGRALRKLDRVQKPESKVRVWSWSLDPIDSIDSYR